jgi:hypothetical protein
MKRFLVVCNGFFKRHD